jgi:hypothetical protein
MNGARKGVAVSAIRRANRPNSILTQDEAIAPTDDTCQQKPPTKRLSEKSDLSKQLEMNRL